MVEGTSGNSGRRVRKVPAQFSTSQTTGTDADMNSGVPEPTPIAAKPLRQPPHTEGEDRPQQVAAASAQEPDVAPSRRDNRSYAPPVAPPPYSRRRGAQERPPAGRYGSYARTPRYSRYDRYTRYPTRNRLESRDRYLIGSVAIAFVLALVLLALVYLLANRQQPTAVATVPGITSGNSSGLPASTPTPAGIVVDLTATPVGLFSQAANPAGANRGQFNLPRGITIDSQGNFYVVDTQNLRVQEFDKSGKFVMMFGSKGLSEGDFNSYSDDAVGTGPGGVAVDKNGNIFVADTWNHRMQKFASDGKFLATWGGVINLAEAPAGADPENNSRFYGPRGVAIGPDGNVYVTDTGNKRVLIFDPNGTFVRKIDSGVTPAKAQANYPFNKPGELNEPIGIAVDGSGNVYVADSRNSRIQKFGPDGTALAQWAVPEGAWAPGPYLEPFLALDSAGNLYATAPTGGSVIKFGPDGKVLGQKKTEGTFTLQTPTGIAVGPDDTIYVVDTAANAVVNFGKMP